ncbi:hypothetical protein E3O42_10355 [Cryobacterium adonitolivorans]|uniref:Uncharacterized protein n=1 Tax=Cryobacterium adonitolivorans TaxID=1259189 RepID=A0A4R8W302_9MICO|nr:hypothetical protein [Cryobacterium adonitolivorans]TFC01507.1 hypothetical protein E3O42_10355 [Cryobacterium adonitolivorans]
MIITYQRPGTLEAHQLDQDAPAADLSPTGATCGTTTVGVLGIQWSCSRAPHPGQDEHRATITPPGDGSGGAVAIAWTYQYATDAQHGDVDQAAPTQSITVTLSFPDRAARGINAAALIRSMVDAGLGHFWEGDQDDVTASSTATT